MMSKDSRHGHMQQSASLCVYELLSLVTVDVGVSLVVMYGP